MQNILKGEVYRDGSSVMMVGPKTTTFSVSCQKCFVLHLKEWQLKPQTCTRGEPTNVISRFY